MNAVTEAELNVKAVAPRVTLVRVEGVIDDVSYYVFPSTNLTVCCIKLTNGFTVTGEAACASDGNFNAELGRRIAYTKAKDKIWMLEGYLLRQQLFDEAQALEQVKAAHALDSLEGSY